MKFLCPSCKAKYQIADEKVAGRSVRMKCRKCGHMIPISKAMTEGSVARGLPGEPATPQVGTPSLAAPEVSPARRVPSAPSAAPAPRAPQRSSPGTLPVVEPSDERISRVHERGPAPATPAATPSPRAAGFDGAAAGLESYGDDECTVIAGAGALAGAFADAVRAPESSALPDLIGSEEWYVGINGVPVGPIRLSALRSKAASGAITEDTLVWRDGFEEWMPLKTFPELIAIVDEGVSSARASLSPLTPEAGPAQAIPFAALPVGTPPPGELLDPFSAALAPAVSALATGPAVITEKQAVGDVDLDVLVPRRRGTAPAAWIAVVVALLFGLTIGFVLFSRQKPAQPIIKYVRVPAKGSEKSGSGGQLIQKPDDTGQLAQKATDLNSSKPLARGGRGHVGGHVGSAVGKPSKEKAGGLAGLGGLASLKGRGPRVGPAAGDVGQAARRQPLDSTAVQRTVSRYTGSVKRSCWQPALDTRGKDAPSSARVSVTIHVSATGKVQGVSTSGDPNGYHGLARCIGSRVRGWQFPASNGVTTVNVPFVFASQ